MKFTAVKFFACISSGAMLLFSCSRFSLDVKPRKYRPGFYISWSVPGKHCGVKHSKVELKNVTLKMPGGKASNELPQVKKPVELKHTLNKISSRHSQNNRFRIAVNKSELKPSVKSAEINKSMDVFIIETQMKDRKSFYWLSGLTALLTAGIAVGQRKRLTKISRWSARNQVLSRCVQVAGHMILSTAALIAGIVLYRQDVIAGPTMIPATLAAFTLAALLYRGGRKRTPITPAYFMKAKMADVTLILSTTLFWASAGNHLAMNMDALNRTGISSTVSMQNVSLLSAAFNHQDESISTEVEKTKEYFGLRVLGFFMVIIGFILTIVALGYLSCSIYCSGNAGGAFIIFFLGLGLCIVGLVKSMKAIMAKGKTPV